MKNEKKKFFFGRGGLIPKIWQILRHFSRALHRAQTLTLWGVCTSNGCCWYSLTTSTYIVNWATEPLILIMHIIAELVVVTPKKTKVRIFQPINRTVSPNLVWPLVKLLDFFSGWSWSTMYDFHDSTDTLKFWTEKRAINKTFLFFIWFWWNLMKL